MLSELVVENLGPIAGAEIVLQPGSSALTGETGAGKTLLVTAVTLLAGGRADRGVVRDGADEARVEGRFVVGSEHPAAEAVRARELADATGDPVEIVITRTIGQSGSRARVNGRLVPVSVLGELGPLLVEIAGQHEHHRLASPRAQRETLDTFAGPEALALSAEVTRLVRELGRVERDLDELRTSARERARELDVLRFEIEEIEAAGVMPGETQRLVAEATRLESLEELSGAFSTAAEELAGEGGADERIVAAVETLRGVADKEEAVAALSGRLDAAAEEVRDVARELSARVAEPDPEGLAGARERLGELGRLRRKYGDDDEQILEYLARAQARAAELASQDDNVGTLEQQADELRKAAADAAAELSTRRNAAATKMKKEIESTLAGLAMPGASFGIRVEETGLYEGGIDAVTFEVATGPGEKPRPVTKVASGGELSRIGLALHLAAADSHASTMIFDEVDAGVGGAAARAVGEALARLGRDNQVLVVTHLPQVAAFAASHFRVRRHDGDRRNVVVERVDAAERVEELSRMLAGLPESERAREHAQELLDLAGAAR